MAFPIKSHLPLITTHIEFQFNVLPPPPLVTTRQDLGARIRRQVRHKSTPYSRPRHICKETRVRSRSVTFDHESESVLSEISDSDEDSEGSVNLNKIPKPNGEAGRANSGGYNLEKALGWEEKRFNAFTVSPTIIIQKNCSYLLSSQQKFINEGVTKKLDIKLCYSKQKPAKIEECIQLVRLYVQQVKDCSLNVHRWHKGST